MARSVLSSAKSIAICTLASRISGLARDVLLAQTFALSWVQDAFSYAFMLPNLFRRLFGEGGLAPVFVPQFTRTLETAGRPAAWRLFHRALALLTVVLVVVALLVELVIAGCWLLADSADPAQTAARRLLLTLSALTLPFMVSICVLSLLAALLNCLGSFVPAALAPVLLNLFMIAGILWVGPAIGGSDPARQVYGVALMVLLAGVVQTLFLLPALRANGVPLGWELTTRDPAVTGMMRMLAPVALGQSVLAFGVFLDGQICVLLTSTAGSPATFDLFGWSLAYPLQEGALSAVNIAQRLYQFPLGVLVISIATAALPAFARHAALQNWSAWGAEVRQLLRLAIFEGILAGAMMLALAPHLVRLLFEYRNFSAADTQRTAAVLAWYGVGMWAFCAQHIISRGFYSVGDVKTPLRISAAVLPLNVLLSFALVWVPGVREAAFAISSAVTYGLAAVAGLLVLQRRGGAVLLEPRLLSALLRMMLAGGAAGLLVWWLAASPPWQALVVAVPGPPLLSRSVDTLGLLALGSVAYLLLARMLGLPEAAQFLALRRRSRSG